MGNCRYLCRRCLLYLRLCGRSAVGGKAEKERLHRKSVRREQPRFLSGTIGTGADFVIIAEAGTAVDTVPVLKEGKVCGLGRMEVFLEKEGTQMSNSLYNRAEVNET